MSAKKSWISATLPSTDRDEQRLPFGQRLTVALSTRPMNHDHPITAIRQNVVELDPYRAAGQLRELAVQRQHVLRTLVGARNRRRPGYRVDDVGCKQPARVSASPALNAA